ncbi:unnamed protein product [Oppiella nova]|uniref:Solute carrier organic anion transporter family member n=1 Tax=Oppiella nova TaxID=334625 RepID=A0A7R9LL26_9ACAR|nr:unnamed protein product [Oppiella nova]CAG2164048.1 unnamed protein product [Oppiella nova]
MAIYSGSQEETPGCGVGSCRPKWIQRWATPNTFVFIFGLISILQGASYVYMMASVTTLERRYAFGSLMSGIILIGDNISEMTSFPIFGYLANRVHRPRLIACSQIVVAIGCYIAALPYFIYGPGVHLLGSTLEDTGCEQNSGSNMATVAFICLFMSMFMNGFGSAACYTIGFPFIDDNVPKKSSPMYLSISTKDPRWVGAWWIGFVVIATAILLVSLPLFMFPNEFQSKSKASENIANNRKAIRKQKSSLDLTLRARLLRLAKNPVYISITVGVTLRLLGGLGYMTFKPKYIESQYKKSASEANLFSGIVGVVPSVIGLFIGGAYITYLKPGAKTLAIVVTVVEVLGNTGMFSAIFLGCPASHFADLPPTNEK